VRLGFKRGHGTPELASCRHEQADQHVTFVPDDPQPTHMGLEFAE
jgi:hypothetical protein